MSQPKAPRSPWRVLPIFLLPVIGVLYLHWKDMTTPIPRFEELRIVSSQGMRYETRCKSSCRMELQGQDGRSFETPYLPRAQIEALARAIEDRGVDLHYGEWDSPIPSSQIFSIYHIRDGETVLMDYAERVQVSAESQSAAVPVVLVSGVVLGLAILGGVRLAAWLRGPDA